MNKTIPGAAVFFLLLFIPLFVSAQTQADVTINPLSDEQVYPNDIEVPVLDFTLDLDNSAQLATVAVKQNGTARYEREFDSVKLWYDKGGDGFQGNGFDTLIDEANESGSRFVFLDAELDISADEAARLFVSVDSGANSQQKQTQFQLTQNDANDDGAWQSTETGLFFTEDTDVSISSSESFKTVHFKEEKRDVKPPKGAFVGIEPYQENAYYGSDAFTIVFNGTAKDRNGGTITTAELLIGEQAISVENTGVGYQSWRGAYSPQEDVLETTVRLHLVDGAGHEWTSPAVDLKIDKRIPSDQESTISVNPASPSPGEEAAVNVMLRDADGATLADRNVNIRVEQNGEVLHEANGLTTDDNGKAMLNFTPNEQGAHKVVVEYNGTDLTEMPFEVTAQEEPATPTLQPGSLIKGPDTPAVYYYSEAGTRHVFLSQDVYASWYGNDFSGVTEIPSYTLASIELGDPITFHPGTLLTAPSVNEVYLVTKGADLRHVANEEVALELFGQSWNRQIHDLSESLLFAYDVKDPVTDPATISLETLEDPQMTIQDELDLRD